MQRVWVFLHLVSLLTAAAGGQPGAGNTATSSSPPTTSSTTTNTTTAVTTGTTSNGTMSVTSADPTSVPRRSTVITTNKTTSQTHSSSEDILAIFLEYVKKPEVLIPFGIGVVLTALVWILTALCCRSKRKRSLDVSETLEMVSTQDPKLCGQDESTQTNGGAEENEVEYSDLDFSALKGPRAAEDVVRENTESEYAEIKKETTEEREQEATEEREEREGEAEEEKKEDSPACEQTEADEQQSLWTEDTDK